MIRLATLTLALTIGLSTALYAQNTEPLKASADGLTVEVSDLRWAPLAQLDGSNRVFGERYGLGFDYRLQQGEQFLKTGQSNFWIEDQAGAKLNLSGSQQPQGQVVKTYWVGLNPHQSYRLVWETKLADAPDAADGSARETLNFRAALPAVGQTLDPKLQQKTAQGARVDLRSIERKSDGIVLTWLWRRPKTISDLDLNLSIAPKAARDDKETDLTGNEELESGMRMGADEIETKITLPVAPNADAKQLIVGLNVSTKAPSQKQAQWFRRVSMPFDGAKLPLAPPDAARAALAQATDKGLTATLESVEDLRGTINARLWFEAATPRGQWRVAQAKVTNNDGSESFIRRSNQLGDDYFFNRNGAMAPGKSGVQLSFSRPEGQTFSLQGEAQQLESSTKTFDFASIPFPNKAGEMVAPKMVKENADGSKLILWKVGRFDTLHQPILAPYSPNPKKPLDWTGLVLVLEYRPAQKSKSVTIKFDDINFRDDTGALFRGGARMKGETVGFGGSDGDVWRATSAKDSSGLTFSDTQKTWYSLFKPLPSANAKSLATTIKIEESAILANLPFRFEAVKLPDANTNR